MAAEAARIVLVVDDEASIRLLCRINLELDGYEVIEAASLDDARSVLARVDVAVSLVDVHVAGADGRTLLPEIEGPKILLTGTIDLSNDDRALADAVIIKPFTIEELLGTVRRVAGAAIHSER